MNLTWHDEPRMLKGIEDCRELVDSVTAQAYDTVWTGPVEFCDYCGETLGPDLEFFADAEINLGEGIWGTLCPVCLTYNGNKMVWGRGQLYQYQPVRKAWLMVAGFPPLDLRREE